MIALYPPDFPTDDPDTGTVLRYADGTAFGSEHAAPALTGDLLADLAVTAMEVRDLDAKRLRQLAGGTLHLVRSASDMTARMVELEEANRSLEAVTEFSLGKAEDADTRLIIAQGVAMRACRALDEIRLLVRAYVEAERSYDESERTGRPVTYDQVTALDEAQRALARWAR